ncbi:hypothetical protein BH23THE1_BH23THE1_15010 [soil metagenome]
MKRNIFGIHHVTAITRDPQKNIDFYSNDLGLRLVKLTVNQDDPTSYHLYFGDEAGRPGTILIFFHWPGIPIGHRGAGEVSTTSFLIPPDSMDYWMERLKDKKIDFQGPYSRFDDEQILSLKGSDGLELELVAHESALYNTLNAWADGPIPIKHAIRGFYSVTLSVEGYERTDTILRNELGFSRTKQDRNRFRYEIPKTSDTNIKKEEEEIIGAPYC